MKNHLLPFFFIAALFCDKAHAFAKVPAQSAAATSVVKLVGTDSKGIPLDLQSLKGKTILLSFYSASCTICERDVKLMREFFRDNRQRNFVLIGVNLEKKKEDFDSYARIVGIATPPNQQFQLIWKDSLKMMEGFGNIKNDPTHFVINKKGEIVLKREGMFRSEDWDFLWESIDTP